MLSRVDDVEVALAQAIRIQQATEKSTHDEVETKEEDRDNWCQNPFCQKALQNLYASYCEERTCQQYRALKLQCVTNAESAIIREMNLLGRSDSFMAVRTSFGAETQQNLRSTDVPEAKKPFIIPRRKRPTNNSEAAAPLNNEHQPSHGSTLPREIATRFRRAVSVDIPGPSSRKRQCLGSRMLVPIHVGPSRAINVPALAVSSHMKARRFQQALRWTEAKRYDRKSRVEPRSFRDPNQANVLAECGCYMRSGNRSSPQHSMRGHPRISRPLHKPPPTTYTQTPQTSVVNKSNSEIERAATRESPALLSQSRDALKKSIPHEEQQSIKYRRSELTGEVVNYHRSYSSQSQKFSNGFSDHRGYRGKTNAAPLMMRRKNHTYTETYQNPYEDDERYHVPQSLYNDVGYRVNRRTIHKTVVNRSHLNYPTAHHDENRWSTSLCPTFCPFPSGIRSSSNTHGSNADDNCVDLSFDQPEYRQQNLPASVPVERFPDVVSPARFTPEIGMAGTEQTISSDTDADYKPTFSFHDPFLHVLLSKFIQKLPSELKPVMNVTKKPRKLKWYIEYIKKIERACKPHVHIQMKSSQIVVMVKNRVWLNLKGPSSVALFRNVIKMMRDEAISWRYIKFEVEQSLDRYRTRLNKDVDLSYVFLRAWNNLKDRPGDISLPRGSNYFCGARRYHWSFIVGQVEIGSGSHEDKRKAFSLAAASAAEFLLKLDDGQNGNRWHPPPRDFNSYESSDDCESLCVRRVNDEPVGAAATTTAITLSDSSDSNTSPVIVSPGEQIDNDQAQTKTTGRVAAAMVIVISSDTEDEDFTQNDAATATDTSNSMQPSTLFAVDASGERTTSTEATATQQCNMCEIIRLRKPESMGCRQCQLSSDPNRISRDAKEGANTHDDAIAVDASTVTKATQVVNSDPEPERASRPTKRLRRIFDMFHMS